jgi:hypothetical protein
MKHLLRNILVAVALSALVPLSASAATLSFSPSAGSYAVGKQFTVKVLVDPGSDSINAADGTVSFDASTLSVVSVSKDGSAFSLWTADPKFSNTDGTVVFSGGTPSPVSSKGTVVAITFKAKQAGTASVTVSKASILAADGKGTDVYTPADGATYAVTAAAAAPPPPADTTEAATADDSVSAPIGGTLPLAPTINSSTQPKQDSWYATTTIALTWNPTADVTNMRLGFSDKADAEPTTTLKVATTSASYIAPSDGTWYFALQYKNDAGWGPAAHFKIQIDTVPPDEFDVALATPASASDPAKLSFKTTDSLSGMDRYEVRFGTTTVGTVKEKDISDGLFTIPPQAGGAMDVTVRAYDKAGNMREATRHLTIPAVVKPVPVDENAPKQSSNILEHVLVLILALGAGAGAAWNMRARKESVALEARILSRVLAVREKNDRIFSAMREEFEQLVQDMDERPQLTPQERDLLEGIKEVLDISEGIIDTSIEELKNEVKGK